MLMMMVMMVMMVMTVAMEVRMVTVRMIAGQDIVGRGGGWEVDDDGHDSGNGNDGGGEDDDDDDGEGEDDCRAGHCWQRRRLGG